jgi:hypothetical protein
LKENINVSSCATGNLKKHKGQLRKAADKSVSLAKEKQIIVQKGDFLGPLLAAVLPNLASILF